jgi:class 3 adenylate cyclase
MRIIGLISTAPSPRRSPGTTASSNDWGASTCAAIFSRLSQRSFPRRTWSSSKRPANAAARRLAAILAADVGGYSWLMGQDEAGTTKAATPIVGSFGGQLVKTMGYGVMPEFSSVSPPMNATVCINSLAPGGGLSLDGDQPPPQPLPAPMPPEGVCGPLPLNG